MKNMIAALSALAVIAAMPVAASANEQKAEQKANFYFKKIDTDGNGMISKAEHNAFGTSMFSEADANKDNQISKEELTAEKKQEMKEFEANKGNM